MGAGGHVRSRGRAGLWLTSRGRWPRLRARWEVMGALGAAAALECVHVRDQSLGLSADRAGAGGPVGGRSNSPQWELKVV